MSKSSTSSFLSLLTGIAAGAVIGILCAPDKGWKTRARVKKTAEKGFENFKEDFNENTKETRESLKSLKDTLLEKSSEIKEGTRDILLRQLDKLEEALRKAEAEEFGGEEEPEEQEAHEEEETEEGGDE